jgi:FixJ family two-component response regulator
MPAKKSSPLVYVVDDEPVIATTVAMILRSQGFNATHFTDPRAALKSAQNLVPSLLLSDVVMPNLSGVELALELLKRDAALKVILFSGQASTSDLLQEAIAFGYSFELLAKPVHPTSLLDAVRKQIGIPGRD